MKKSYWIRIDSKIFDWVVWLWWDFTKWIQKLYDEHNNDTSNMEYPEMVQVFKSMKDLLIKYRPEPQTTLQEFADTKEIPVIDKIQKLNDIAKWKTLNKSDWSTKVWNNKDYQDANMLFWKIRIGLKKNNWKMQDNDWFDCTRQKRVTLEWWEYLIPLLETMIK